MISVIIPVYNDAKRLLKLLKSIKLQSFKDYELIVVDDCSTDNTPEIAKKYAKVISTDKNSGPATARNIGIKKSIGNIIAFTDSDCIVDKDWLKNIELEFNDKNTDALMGKVNIPKAGIIGDSISALGFPAGGSIGYEKMYKVKNGITNHISTCNCAFRRSVFKKSGFFDESFPTPGREDTEFSYRIWKNSHRIRYSKKVVIEHVARKSIRLLIKMNYNRGRGTYHFKKKLPHAMKYFEKLRVWSTKNMILSNLNFRLPLILLLFTISAIAHQKGYIDEKNKYSKSNK